jgi:folate-binding protein YgfZ
VRYGWQSDNKSVKASSNIMNKVTTDTTADASKRDAAIIDVGRWEVVRAVGGERLAFLHRLLTATLDELQPGHGRRALLLTVKAQIVTELIVCQRPEEVLLLVPPGQGAIAAVSLSRYAIMDDVSFTHLPDREVLGVYGQDAAAAFASAGIDLPPAVVQGQPLAHAEVMETTLTEATTGPLWVVRNPGYGGEGFWVVAEPAATKALAARLDAAGVPMLGAEVAEARRILAGEPKFGAEITDDVFPMEVALDPLIDYSKGCYLGQEPIVRVRDRGHVNWRLVGLRAQDSGPIAAGDRLESDARPKAGRITSAAAVSGQPTVALALLHVSLPAGTTVRIRHEDSTVNAVVVELPGSGAGAAPAATAG